jgi:hypothetical protein
MIIKKQNDGSNKVFFENGEYFFVEKGKDPIDGAIDIGLEQKKTAAAIEDKYSIEGNLKPETFFFFLNLDYHTKAWGNPQNKQWYVSAINDFNLEIKRQQLSRKRKGIVDDAHSFNEIYPFKEGECGKYFIDKENTVPEFVLEIPESTIENEELEYLIEMPETPEELEQRLIATTLLNFIYCRIDIRKIENRISELKGLCAYLKIIAPDEFNAYCTLGDKIGLDAELDIDRYYELLRQLTSKR